MCICINFLNAWELHFSTCKAFDRWKNTWPFIFSTSLYYTPCLLISFVTNNEGKWCNIHSMAKIDKLRKWNFICQVVRHCKQIFFTTSKSQDLVLSFSTVNNLLHESILEQMIIIAFTFISSSLWEGTESRKECTIFLAI